MYPIINFRKMNKLDIDQVMNIESLCFISPWTKPQLIGELEDNKFANIYVAEFVNSENKLLVGFYDYWITFDSATIAQIAVHPSFQKQGIASKMMQEIIDDCYAKRVNNITLEVRENNEKARNLYKKFGFEEILVKPNYYSNGDNAVYMSKGVL